MNRKRFEHGPMSLSGFELAEYIHATFPGSISATAVAKKIGRSQTYVSKQRQIWQKVASDLRERWRQEQVPVAIMYALSRLDTHAEQRATFQKLMAVPRVRSRWARRGRAARSAAASRTTTLILTAEDDHLLRELQKKRPSMTQTSILRRALELLAQKEGVLPASRGRR
jgi:hypothetical protein